MMSMKLSRRKQKKKKKKKKKERKEKKIKRWRDLGVSVNEQMKT